MPDPAADRRRDAALAIDAGADFIKTSTGKIAGLRHAGGGGDHARRSSARRGRPVGFKAAGGIRTLADAALYLGLAERHHGRRTGPRPTTFRIGASSLHDALLAAIDGAGRRRRAEPGPTDMPMLPQEIIRQKRDGGALSRRRDRLLHRRA